jgi:xylulokinase
VTDILRLTTEPAVLQQLDSEANYVSPGANGLIILPYFIGEKTPLFDPHARGVFFGLSLAHTRGHIFRAILEAVIYGFRHHVEELETLGFPVKRILATNGGVKSQIWRQIAADVLGKPIQSFPGHPGSVLGVACLAAHNAGLVKSWNDIELFLTLGREERPIEAHQLICEQAYQLYRKVYIDLKNDFPLLTRIGG